MTRKRSRKEILRYTRSTYFGSTDEEEDDLEEDLRELETGKTDEKESMECDEYEEEDDDYTKAGTSKKAKGKTKVPKKKVMRDYIKRDIIKNMSPDEVLKWWEDRPKSDAFVDFEILPLNSGSEKFILWSCLGRKEFCELMHKFRNRRIVKRPEKRMEILRYYLATEFDKKCMEDQLHVIITFLISKYKKFKVRGLVARCESMLKCIDKLTF